MDEFENQPQQTTSAEEIAGTSRRKFLKAAVVSSAAAAAAVGTAGVAASALASRAPSGLSKLLVLSTNLVSTQDGCWTFTTAPFVGNSQDNPFNDNEDVFMFAWFTGLSAGTYSLTLNSPATLPSYLSFNGNKVQVFPNVSGCPTAAPTGAIASANDLSAPVSFTIDSSVTSVLVWLQMHAKNVPGGTVLTMTLELSNGGSYDVTASATAFFK
jgi:hypothetical protein